jgi:hypothetical protein
VGLHAGHLIGSHGQLIATNIYGVNNTKGGIVFVLGLNMWYDEQPPLLGAISLMPPVIAGA